MTTLGLVFRILNGVLMIGLPVLAALLIYRRGERGFHPVWIGVVGFILSQVGHLPFNRFALLPGLEALGVDLSAQAGSSMVFLALGAGLSAGVFEEVTRYLVFRYWLKGSGSLLPIKYGIGHGGIEALLAGMLVLYALVQVLVLSGDAALAAFPAETAEQIRSQLATYWAVPWGQTLLGAWERFSAMLFHIGASLLVFKSVREKNILWLAGALLGHTALDALAVIGVKTINIFLVEGLIFGFSLLWVIWAWMVRVRDRDSSGADSPAPLDLSSEAPQVTSQQLEESRYE